MWEVETRNSGRIAGHPEVGHLTATSGAPIVVQFEDEVGYHGPAKALAYATPYRESGTCIHVFLDRVLRVSQHISQSFANTLLAHVMVHENHPCAGTKRPAFRGGCDESSLVRPGTIGTCSDYPLPLAPEDVDGI